MEVVAPTADGIEGIGLSIQDIVAYTERLKREFDFLASLFNQVSLRTNTMKTVSIACQPCHVPGHISSEAYNHQMTGTGPTLRERQRRRVACPEFGVDIVAGLLLTHCQIQNVVGWGEGW